MAESALERLAKRLEQRRDTPGAEAPKYAVLVCDDEWRNVEALERVLREKYVVAPFTSGFQALEAVRSGAVQPDLVLSDQRMPGMGGVELLERVSELRPACMRVILSGYAEKSDLISAINRGRVYHYITKPWFPEELLHTVGKALEHYQLQLDQQELTGKLQESNERLATANSQLEELVQQRTNALQQVNGELQRVNEQLAKLAVTDPLTNLYNQRFFHEFLSREVRRSARYGEPISVVMADIDHFKAFNDRYGHPAGDKALQRLAEIFRMHIREPDVVGRYGGEEFIIILPHTEQAGACTAAERLREAISTYRFHCTQENAPASLTASFGIATYHPPAAGERAVELSASELISRADHALYASKHGGRNRVSVFSGNTEKRGK